MIVLFPVAISAGLVVSILYIHLTIDISTLLFSGATLTDACYALSNAPKISRKAQLVISLLFRVLRLYLLVCLPFTRVDSYAVVCFLEILY